MKRKMTFPVILQFFLSHVLLVVLFVVGTMVINGGYSSVLNSVVSNTAKNDLIKSADILAERLEELRSSAYIVAQNNNVASFSAVSAPSVEHYARLYELDSQMEAIYGFNDYINGLILWFNRSGSAWTSMQKIASRVTGYLDPLLVDTTENVLTIQGVSLKSFEEELAQRHELSVFQRRQVRQFSDEPQEYFLYSFQLRPLSSSRVDASLTFLLNPQPIRELLAFDVYGGMIRILNLTGEVIYDSSDGTAFPAFDKAMISEENTTTVHDHIIFTYRPPTGDCVYQLAVPQSYISDRVWLTQRTNIIIAVLIALTSLGLSFYFSHVHAKPVRKIASLAKLPPGNRNEYAAIYASVSKLLQDSAALTSRLEAQKIAQIHTIFSKLLAYEFRSEEDVLDALDSVDILPGTGAYEAVYIHLYIPEKLDEDSAQIIFEEVLSSTVSGILCIYPLLNHSYAVFCQESGEAKVPLLSVQLEHAIQLLQKKAGFHMLCVLGPSVSAMLEWPESLQAARKMGSLASDVPVDQVVPAPKPAPGCSTQWIPEALRCHMTNLCLAGDADALDILLRDYFTTKRNGEPLSELERLQIGFDMRSTLLQLEDQLPFNMNLGAMKLVLNCLPNAATLDQLQEGTLEVLHEVCRVINAQKQSAPQQLCERVREYINTHYADMDISLSSIARSMNMNEKYLSQVYKKESKQNLTADIENVRMRHVLELMRGQPDMTLENICTACGYSSLNSFYKAFKRVYGVSPSAYRRQLTEGAV